MQNLTKLIRNKSKQSNSVGENNILQKGTSKRKKLDRSNKNDYNSEHSKKGRI